MPTEKDEPMYLMGGAPRSPENAMLGWIGAVALSGVAWALALWLRPAWSNDTLFVLIGALFMGAGRSLPRGAGPSQRPAPGLTYVHYREAMERWHPGNQPRPARVADQHRHLHPGTPPNQGSGGQRR